MKSLPKLRSDLVIIPQVNRGETTYVYKVLETGDYYNLDSVQHGIISLLDGERTAEELLEEFQTRNRGARIDSTALMEYIEGFRGTDLFEKSREDRKRILLETIRDRRKAQAAHRSRYGSLFEITLPAWNPNRFFERAVPHLRFFWTPAFVWVSLVCILAMLVIWVIRWDEVRDGTLALFSFQDRTSADIFQFYIIIFVIGFLHESAHGLTCKRFGGDVTQMGLLFLYFAPCFFVDVSDAYLLKSHFRRQWVIFAGGYFETFLCALATFLWALTSPGSMVHEFSYKMLLMMGLSSVIINYNPLIKLDGYYSLMDYLEIPDLSERSFAYLNGWLKKHLLRLPVQLELVSRKVRRIFFIYAVFSFLYKVFLIGFFMFLIRNVFVALMGSSGNMVFLFVLLFLMRNYLRKLLRVLKFLFLDKREIFMTRRSLSILGTAAGALFLVAVFLKFPVAVRADFYLEPDSIAFVRAGEEGRIAKILVMEGQHVEKGELLAFLKNEDLAVELKMMESRLKLIRKEIEAAAGRGKPAEAAKKIRERNQVEVQIRIYLKRVDELMLRAPIGGVVTTARLDEKVGTYLHRGDLLCEIIQPEELVARIPVREAELDQIRSGQRVDLQLISFPYQIATGSVVSLAPASRPAKGPGNRRRSEGVADFEVIVEILQGPEGIRTGMAGTAWIQVGRATPARRAGRAFRRWIGTRIW